MFCPVYKTAHFSTRPVEHVKKDIDLVRKHVETLRQLLDDSGRITIAGLQKAAMRVEYEEWHVFDRAADWVYVGDMKSVFLQDADSLVIKPTDMVAILTHLRKQLPFVRRVTSYARAKTIASRKVEDLKAIKEAGLDRIHIGLESGSDEVLARVNKGSTKEIQIKAGLKVKQAGMELSEYVMPGLGGQDLWEIHAIETADALSQINPDFIRLRTLAIPPQAPLFEEWQAGRFKKCTDLMIAKEMLLFIEKLDGITSYVKSDHILNLFMELQGKLPEHKQRMIDLLSNYLGMEPEDQRLYQVGRRLGILTRTRDLENPHKKAKVEKACRKLGITADNVDEVTDQLMTRFV